MTFTAELLKHGMNGSIGTVGDALDNALCESTIGLFETEAIHDGGPTWANRRAVEWQVARCAHWYNHQRLHSSIGNLPPVEFEHHHRQATTVTPSRRSRNQHALRESQDGSPHGVRTTSGYPRSGWDGRAHHE